MSANDKYPQPTTSQIASGMAQCRGNARELLHDAKLLEENLRYARAYMVLHTACEELAKFFILELAGRRLSQGNPPSWKRFWQRFRNHDSKIAQLSVQLLALRIEGGAIDPDLLAAADTLFSYELQPRNASLYVDMGQNGEFRSPNDIDFSVPLPTVWGVVTLALRAANQRGETVNELHSHLQKASTEPDQNAALKVLEIAVRRMADAGLSESEIIAAIEKRIPGT